MTTSDYSTNDSALNRATRKAYWRLMPLLFVCYVIAYVDRANVSIAKLTMTKDLGFDNAVIGFASGVFFIGYFLLEVPGSILCERWSARKWLSRIMITWGIIAAATAWIKTANQFYALRFLLGLAEAGFFPGAIVYLTHWFPKRDRARALALFMVATPLAQIVSPKLSGYMLPIGTDAAHPAILGMVGWQWIYIVWGIPAFLLGFAVLFLLPDHPRHAKWLAPDEKEALEGQLAMEAAHSAAHHRMRFVEALRNPKVLLLALSYFLIVTGNYGIEFFLPSILERWYSLKLNSITWLILLPPIVALASQLFVGWNSDRTKERTLHTAIPIILGGIAMGLAPFTQGNLWLTIACFMIAAMGVKAYLPAFWALPNMFLTSTAAAGSIGMINAIGNLGGFTGPYIVGKVEALTGSFVGGLYYLAVSMVISAIVILLMKFGKDHAPEHPKRGFEPIMAEASQEST